MPPNKTLLPRGFRVKDAAAYLGTSMSFIRRAVWNRELPAMKLGKRLIIAKEDLDRFFDRLKKTNAV